MLPPSNRRHRLDQARAGHALGVQEPQQRPQRRCRPRHRAGPASGQRRHEPADLTGIQSTAPTPAGYRAAGRSETDRPASRSGRWSAPPAPAAPPSSRHTGTAARRSPSPAPVVRPAEPPPPTAGIPAAAAATGLRLEGRSRGGEGTGHACRAVGGTGDHMLRHPRPDLSGRAGCRRRAPSRPSSSPSSPCR